LFVGISRANHLANDQTSVFAGIQTFDGTAFFRGPVAKETLLGVERLLLSVLDLRVRVVLYGYVCVRLAAAVFYCCCGRVVDWRGWRS